MTNNRYYTILDLKKEDNPSDEEIKRAYKKKALKWHPDRNIKKKREAEEKFKEINEAYEILSDSKKRKLYDQYGEDVAQGKMGTGTPFDPSMFNRPSGGSHFVFTNINSNGFSNNNFRNPNDIFASVFGSKNVNDADGIDIFNELNGFGGLGNMNRKQQKIEYPLKLTLDELCNGITKKIKVTTNNNPEIFTIDIKKGWKEGTRITFNTKQNREIVFIIKQLPHKYFIRENNDLKWYCVLSKKQLDKGVKITLNTPMLNETIEVNTKNKYIKHASKITFSNKGMPIKGGPNRGDLIIEFRVN